MRRPFSASKAVGWSLTWALGAGIGVALGAYLTVVGAQAAPGDVALDATELLVLPLVAAAAVFVISFVGRLGFALVGGGAPDEPDGTQNENEENQNDNVTGHVE